MSKFISDEDVWEVVKESLGHVETEYTEKSDRILDHQIIPYNKFVESDIPSIIERRSPLKIKVQVDSVEEEYLIEFGEVTIIRPKNAKVDGTHVDLFPQVCIDQNIPYMADVLVDIIFHKKHTDLPPTIHKNVLIGSIPVMVWSTLCSLHPYKNDYKKIASLREDIYGYGGYFIVSGSKGNVSEKIITTQQRDIINKTCVFIRKNLIKRDVQFYLYSSVHSYNSETKHKTILHVGLRDNKVYAAVPYIKTENIPIGILFTALGVSDPLEMLKYMGYSDDTEARKFLLPSFEMCVLCNTKEDALLYIGVRGKKFSSTTKNEDEADSDEKAISYANHLLTNELLPHTGSGEITKKLFYIGHMIKKLIDVQLKRLSVDDRDSYVNKRVETPGQLISNQFDYSIKKLFCEIANGLEKGRQRGTPINIHSLINHRIITKMMTSAIISNLWMGNKEDGVSQQYSRINYMGGVANARRIEKPTDNKGGKILLPRYLHGSHWMAACPAETPEGGTCLPLDTLIATPMGQKQIGDLRNGDEVVTVDPVTLLQTTTTIEKYFQITSDVSLITLEGGDKIKATADHPFLKDGEWVKTGDLQKGDELVVRYTSPKSNEKDCIWARILGFSFADAGIYGGDKCKAWTGFFGTMQDAREFMDDIEFLGYSPVKIRERNTTMTSDDGRIVNQHTFITTKGGEFCRTLIRMGAPVRKKTTQPLYIPDIIKNATNDVKLEFIAGFQGGDGGSIAWKKRTEKKNAYDIKFIRTSKHSYHPNELYNFFQWMKDVLQENSIECCDIRRSTSRYDKTLSKIELPPSSTLENIENYMDKVGYRYCFQKETKGSRVWFYAKYKNEKWTERIDLKKKIVKEHEDGIRPSALSKKYNLTVRQVGGMIEQKGKYTFPPRDILTIEKFLEERWMGEFSCKTPIASITRDISTEKVADFTTISDNHSFIANNIITHNCGLITNLSLSCHISTGSPATSIYIILSTFDIYLISNGKNDTTYTSKVILNGDIIGFAKSAQDIATKIREIRRKGSIEFEISVCYDYRRNEVIIYTDEGRVGRYAFIVANGNLRFTKSHSKIIKQGGLDDYPGGVWMALLDNGLVEFIDKQEEENCLFICNPSDLVGLSQEKKNKITHCELHPSLMFGVGASSVPFPDHNQSPRVAYQASMTKQAIGNPIANSMFRTKKGKFHTMMYPQIPLVQSLPCKLIGYNNSPSGQNAVVFVCPWDGFSQEDSLIMNQDSIDRGFMLVTTYNCVEGYIHKDKNERFEVPLEAECINSKGSPAKLDRFTGIIAAEMTVNSGDILIGMTSEIETKNGKRKKDISIVYNHPWSAKIHYIQQGIDGNGYEYVKVVTAQQRPPTYGDKFCFSPDHELLTDSGWVDVADISLSHKLATLTDSHELVYDRPTQIHQFDHDGDMIEVDTDHVSLCVTPNHRMYVKRKDKFEMVEAQDLFEAESVFYKKNADTYTPSYSPPFLNIGKSRFDMNEWCMYFGRCIYFGRCQTTDRDISSYIFKYINEEILPRWCFSLSQFQSQILLFGLFGGKEEYNTRSTQFKDDIMQLSLHSGYSADAFEEENRIWRIFLVREENEPIVEKQRIIVYTGKVYCCTVPHGKIYVRRKGKEQKPVWSGNSANHGQKGTVGMTYRCYDLPFTTKGQSPDIMINPLAFPSRMTIGMLLELLLGRNITCSALDNVSVTAPFCEEKVETKSNKHKKVDYSPTKINGDATPFQKNFSISDICASLKKMGINEFSDEVVINGRTGEQMPCLVFTGLCYYQRLHHMVIDKIHGRSRGRKQRLTNQPVEGRSQGGGQRFGEMEKDCIMSHGLPNMIRDRMMEQSDRTTMWFCQICGLQANYSPADYENNLPETKECKVCEQTEKIVCVELPHSAILIIQNCMAMNIVIRVLTSDIYDDEVILHAGDKKIKGKVLK